MQWTPKEKNIKYFKYENSIIDNENLHLKCWLSSQLSPQSVQYNSSRQLLIYARLKTFRFKCCDRQSYFNTPLICWWARTQLIWDILRWFKSLGEAITKTVWREATDSYVRLLSVEFAHDNIWKFRGCIL